MSNKRWRHEFGTEKLLLVFAPFYDEEVVAELFKDEDGDWCYTSELMNVDNEYLCNRDTSEHDAKLEVEECIYNHYEGERNYNQDLMDKFSGEID